jgi:hypothetical protein
MEAIATIGTWSNLQAVSWAAQVLPELQMDQVAAIAGPAIPIL